MPSGSLRPWREQPLQAGDTELFVREWGQVASPPLLFWHALGDHTGLQVAEAAQILVADFGLRVIALDAPGFGESPPVTAPEDYTLRRLAGLVVSTAGALALDRPVLVGSSWGGSVGVATAATAPESIRGIALLDSGYQSGFEG